MAEVIRLTELILSSVLADEVRGISRLRILLLNWRDWMHPRAGGAELYLHEVAREWSLAGHQVTFFCAGSPGLADIELLDHMTIIRRGNRYSLYREAKRFCQREVEGNFDLVIDTINTRPFFAPFHVPKVPVFGLAYQLAREVWFHEMPLPVAAAGRYYFEPRWMKRYAQVPTLTISESSRSSLMDYGLEDVRVVPVGIAAPVIPDVQKADRPTVLFCGRLAPNKRPDHAIKAFVKARASLPADAQMWVVGSGPMEECLRNKFEKDVTFFGRISHEEKFELMARAHLLSVTSVREGWGMVVSEAATVGTPSVGYDVPGLRDSVRSAGGVLVAPTVDAMAGALTDNLKNWAATPPVSLERSAGVKTWSEVATAILEATGMQLPTSINVDEDNAAVSEA